MTASVSDELAVIDTDVWSHLYGSKQQIHPDAQLWRQLLSGLTLVVAAQTRAEVLSWVLQRNLGETRRTAILSQLDATPTTR